jgi:hypothetical protein
VFLNNPFMPGKRDPAKYKQVDCEGCAPTCPAVVPLCGTKAEVTVPSLDDWETDWERAEM